MSQASLVVPSHPTGENLRLGFNAALEALATGFSGATAPAETYPFQVWQDLASGLRKSRSPDDSAWLIDGVIPGSDLDTVLGAVTEGEIVLAPGNWELGGDAATPAGSTLRLADGAILSGAAPGHGLVINGGFIAGDPDWLGANLTVTFADGTTNADTNGMGQFLLGKLQVYREITNPVTENGLAGLFKSIPVFTENSGITFHNLDSFCYPTINTGKTFSGSIKATVHELIRNYIAGADDAGAVSGYLIGDYHLYGHSNANAIIPTTAHCVGLALYPLYKTGTITELIDFLIDAGEGGGTVTTHFSIKQMDTTAINLFRGRMTVGDDLLSSRFGVISTGPDTHPLTVYNSTGTILLDIVEGSGATSNKGVLGLSTTAGLKIYLNTNGDSYFKGGNIGIGTDSPTYLLTMEVSGGGYYSASDHAWHNGSSIRMKHNVETIAKPLALVKALRGVTWTWKDSGLPGTGLIAEEVRQVIPSVVTVDQADPEFCDGLSEGRLIGVLVEAIKAQQAQINSLTAKLN